MGKGVLRVRKGGMVKSRRVCLRVRCLAFMGTNVISGRATALVLVVGDDTMMGAIEQTINTYDEPTSFEREMNSISWLLIRLMLVMVPVVFVINGLTDGDWLEAGVFALVWESV